MRQRLYYGNPINPSHPLNRGLAGRWKVLPWYAISTRMPDLTNGHYNGTLTNGALYRPTTRPGGFGQVFLDGSNDYVNCGGLAASSVFGAFLAMSMACWVRPTSFTPAYSGIISRSDAASVFQQILVKSTGKLAMYLNCASVNTVSYDGTGTTTLTAGTWYRVMLTYDSVAGLKGYVNGVLDGSAAANGTITPGATAHPLTLGQDEGSGSRFLAGSVDDGAIWNRALRASEVRRDFELTSMFIDPTLCWVHSRTRQQPAATVGGLLLARRRAAVAA